MKPLLYLTLVLGLVGVCLAACDLKWVKTDHKNIPANAVLVVPNNMAGDFYVGRASHQGVLTPGRFKPAEEQFFYTMDGKEYGIRENFEVLTNPNNCYLDWKYCYGGTLPKNAIVVGADKSGQPAYSARYKEQFGYMVGKYYKSTKTMYYGWGGGEHPETSYEILVEQDGPPEVMKPSCKNYMMSKEHYNFVCVCSEAEPCPKLEGATKTPAGVVSRWETRYLGARMVKQSLKLDDKGRATPIDKVGSQYYIKLNRDKKFQEIVGFGGAFTDATGVNLKAVSPKLADQMIVDYFGKDGLEYNMGRNPIGGSDFSTRGYTLDDNNRKDDKDLSHFALEKEDLELKIPYMLRAKQLSPQIKLFGSPWSAPGWMKENYYPTEPLVGGNIKGKVGSEYWQIYAKYFVKYLETYKAKNLTHWGLTVQNEPLAGVPWNSMGYNAESERDFVKTTLGPELERSGWGVDKLKLMVLDHNVGLVPDWVNKHYSDPVAAKYTSGTAIHWYGHDPKTMLDAPHDQHPDKFLLATEACMEGGVRLGDWNSAHMYTWDIIQDLLHHVTGWVDWNMVLDLQGGPNWKKNYVDAPIIVDADKHQYYRQPMFYALAHFTKFLPPGSVRVDASVINNNDNHVTVAVFRTPDAATVIIAYNQEDIDVDLIVEDDKSSGKLIQKISGRSIQTYVYFD